MCPKISTLRADLVEVQNIRGTKAISEPNLIVVATTCGFHGAAVDLQNHFVLGLLTVTYHEESPVDQRTMRDVKGVACSVHVLVTHLPTFRPIPINLQYAN